MFFFVFFFFVFFFSGFQPGPEVIKLFSCSAQLILKFILLLNVKMPTIVGFMPGFSTDWLFSYLCAIEISCSTQLSPYNLGTRSDTNRPVKSQ